MTSRYRRPSRLARFLYINGPDVGGAAFLLASLALCVMDYFTQPLGFTRFLVAVVVEIAHRVAA